ncbi:hypothetical protein LEMLEM_LOCUS15351 [Lemmus lemmus]
MFLLLEAHFMSLPSPRLTQAPFTLLSPFPAMSLLYRRVSSSCPLPRNRVQESPQMKN